MTRRTPKFLHAALLLLLGSALVLLETAQFKLLLTSFVAGAASISFPFFERHRNYVRRAAFAIFVLSMLGVSWLLPPRRAALDARVQSVFLDRNGNRVDCPWLPYLANLVPEGDLIRLSTLLSGFFPFPVQGPILDELRDMSPLDNVFVREYRTLRREDIDRQVPSVLFLQLLQHWGYYRDLNHFVVVLPEKRDAPVPLLVFLHGYMGNFQFYSNYFSSFSNAAVLIPSTKDLNGAWRQQDLNQLLGQNLKAVETSLQIDRSRLHLVGLSNGGSGVNLAARTRSSSFKSLTFLSTWVDPIPPQLPSNKSIAVVYGEGDRISANNRQMVHWMREHGYSVKAYPFEGERHFLMLTRKEEVLKAIRSATGLGANKVDL